MIKTDKLTYTTIGIDFKYKEQVIDVAKEVIANGAQMIELCDGVHGASIEAFLKPTHHTLRFVEIEPLAPRDL